MKRIHIHTYRPIRKQVITTASSSEKLDFLKSMHMPPTDTINYKTEDFSKRVNEITEGKGVDLIIDFVGKVGGRKISHENQC